MASIIWRIDSVLAGVAPRVVGQEPVEAEVRIVGTLLLGIEQREAGFVGELRPARMMVVGGRGLRAAVQHDHQRRSGPMAGRKVVARLEGAGIGTEARERQQPVGCRLATGRPVCVQRLQRGEPRDGVGNLAQGIHPGWAAGGACSRSNALPEIWLLHCTITGGSRTDHDSAGGETISLPLPPASVRAVLHLIPVLAPLLAPDEGAAAGGAGLGGQVGLGGLLRLGTGHPSSLLAWHSAGEWRGRSLLLVRPGAFAVRSVLFEIFADLGATSRAFALEIFGDGAAQAGVRR
jgi:hypothetical protein